MGTSNKFFEWNFLPSIIIIIIIITFPRIRISIHKFIINEEIKSELEERIVKMAGNGEISIKRDVVETRFKKEKEKERKKRHYTPVSTEFPSTSNCTFQRGKKKKISPLITDPATAQMRR